MGWGQLVSEIDCYTREIVSWNPSNRCRTGEGIEDWRLRIRAQRQRAVHGAIR